MNELLLKTIMDGHFSFFGHLITFSLTGYAIAIILLNIVVYGMYIYRLTGRQTMPPISTWCLWLLLNTIATTALFANGVFNLQMVVYTIGTLAVCFVLIRQPNISWNIWDTVTTAFVLLSIATWYATSDPEMALYITLTGITVAYLPMYRGIIKGSDEPLDAWLLALFGSYLCYLSEMSLSSKLMGVLQSLIVILVFIYKKEK